MSKKKSLGHNPLAYSTRSHASFDFITTSEDQKAEAVKNGDENKVNKITASYYLEEPLVNKVRYLAEKKDTSFSALVNEILKDSLRDISPE